MSCIEAVQINNVESVDYQIELAIGILLAGLIIVGLIIAIIVFICFRKYIITCCKRLCCCCACCCCCCAFLDDRDKFYWIHSWEEPELEETKQLIKSNTLMSAYDDDESLQLLNSEFTLHMSDSATNSIVAESDYYSKSTIMTKGTAVWAISDDYIDAEGIAGGNSMAITSSVTKQIVIRSTFQSSLGDLAMEGSSFKDIFMTSRWKKNYVLFFCDTNDINKFNADFHQQLTYFFLTLIETTCIKIMKEMKVTEKWKADRMVFFKESVSIAQDKHITLVATKKKELEEVYILTVECSILAMFNEVLENIFVSLQDTSSLTPNEVKILVMRLRQELEQFEISIFDIYLKQAKNLRSRIYFRDTLMMKLFTDLNEIIELMQSHQNKHFEQLNKIRMMSSASNESTPLALEVEKIWNSTIKNFEQAVSEHTQNLKCDGTKANGAREKFNIDTEIEKEKLFNGKPTKDYIKSYCNNIRQLLESEANSSTAEITYIARELSTIIKTLGVTFVTRGVQDESALYLHTSTPTTVNIITQLQEDLENLPRQMRSIQLQQEADLQSIIRGPTEMHKETAYFSEVEIDENFIKTIMDIHVDIPEKERKVLRNKLHAEIKCSQLHLELCKLFHERRITNELVNRKATLLAQKEASSSMYSNIHAIAVEEQLFETDYQRQIEQIKKILHECTLSTKSKIEIICRNEIENIKQHLHESTLEGQESTLKHHQLLQEHQININVLDEELQRSKKHQERVLLEKIQARKLKRIEDGYTKTNHRFVANCWVRMLLEVRHKQALKELAEFHALEGKKIKMKLKKCYELNTKHSVQFHKKELIVKLAAALNMAPKELEEELHQSAI